MLFTQIFCIFSHNIDIFVDIQRFDPSFTLKEFQSFFGNFKICNNNLEFPLERFLSSVYNACIYAVPTFYHLSLLEFQIAILHSTMQTVTKNLNNAMH